MSVLLALSSLVVSGLELSLALGIGGVVPVSGGGSSVVAVLAIAVGAGGLGFVATLSPLMVTSKELLPLVVLAVPVLCSLVVTGY